MNFKIDTKEKFKEITILESHLSANMTDELENLFKNLLEEPVNNVVLSMKPVIETDTLIAQKIASLQQLFYESGASFVVCEVQQPVEMMLDASGLLEIMNTTPTTSEAWDIVQMEEIERELLNDF
ncbi:MAG: STAS domain-containing protein [Bacteroidota bacterium]